MSALEVRIAKLGPLRFIRFYGFGANPERLAIQALADWAAQRSYLQDRLRHRIFGFNNPDPSPDRPDYGYDLWLTLGEGDAPPDDATVQEFAGGLYAVARCQGAEQIGATWERLVEWLASSGHSLAPHQWLEEHLNEAFPAPDEELLLDLYAPISE